jgi:hypothetical protein
MPGSFEDRGIRCPCSRGVMEPVPRSPVGVGRRNARPRGGPGVQYLRTMQRFVATKNKVATYAVGVSLYSISR